MFSQPELTEQVLKYQAGYQLSLESLSSKAFSLLTNKKNLKL